MASLVRGVFKAMREKGLGNFIKEIRDEGYLSCEEQLSKIDRRHRWVEYAEKGRYNASQVPPEWHGWLHHITDHTGDELLMLKPRRYGVEHKENLSGEGEQYIYHSKGHALNPGQRDWTRYQPWQSKDN